MGDVKAQETTLTQEDNGAVVTTSIAPTTYTDASGATLTWTASTPSTPIPSVRSSGSVMRIQDYISTVSGAGEAAATGGVGKEVKQNYAGATSGAAGGQTMGRARVAGVLLGGVVGVAAGFFV
ncbi:hypothetical protein JCM8547_008158 [Rhodosporidiobolus lusitaniae]